MVIFIVWLWKIYESVYLPVGIVPVVCMTLDF